MSKPLFPSLASCSFFFYVFFSFRDWWILACWVRETENKLLLLRRKSAKNGLLEEKKPSGLYQLLTRVPLCKSFYFFYPEIWEIEAFPAKKKHVSLSLSLSLSSQLFGVWSRSLTLAGGPWKKGKRGKKDENWGGKWEKKEIWNPTLLRSNFEWVERWLERKDVAKRNRDLKREEREEEEETG